jgi:hypothetical protein
VTHGTQGTAHPRYAPYYIRKIKEAHPMQITRAALIQCIEGGIASARTLTEAEKVGLRLVGIVADEVGRTFSNCPLTQAGLAFSDPAWTERLLPDGSPRHLFSRAFDRLVQRTVSGAEYGCIGTLQVID